LADIFVSYSRQDKARVQPLVAALQAEGWSIWWDPEIQPGEEFDPHLARGEAEKALDWFQRGQSLDTAIRSYDAMIVRALAALGRREEAEEILTRLESESRQHYVRAEYLAMGHAAVGDFDAAFNALERAYQARSAGLVYLHLDPGYEPLRSDPRYKELVQRIGLH
jgi:tetratricopeptide (TPR) repeat protein